MQWVWAVFHFPQLATKCDVLIENFLPGKLEEIGLGYEQLKCKSPHLIYCSLTGYGQTGPYMHKGGYDIVASAIGGLMHITGPEVCCIRDNVLFRRNFSHILFTSFKLLQVFELFYLGDPFSQLFPRSWKLTILFRSIFTKANRYKISLLRGLR